MLTDRAIRKLKPREKLYRIAGSGGLCIEVTPTGSKLWRYRYRANGAAKMIALGDSYPNTSLSQARELRDEQRKLVRAGVDPSLKRKRYRALGDVASANTFEACAREWLSIKPPVWVPEHVEKVKNWLEQHVFPTIGPLLIADLDAPELLVMLNKLKARGTLNSAERVRQTCSAILRYAIVTGRAKRDAAADLRGGLPTADKTNFASITEPKAVGELLRAIDGFQGTPITLAALRLAPLVFCRPGELRAAKWTEFDLDAAEWCIEPGSCWRVRGTQSNAGPIGSS